MNSNRLCLNVPNERSAFTLMETILALSLSAVLLAGIYAAMEQSWRMTAGGREEMERAQLARALINRLEVDIRAITYVPPPPLDGSTSSTATTTATAAATTATSSTTPTQTVQSSTSSGSSSGGGGSGGGGSGGGKSSGGGGGGGSSGGGSSGGGSSGGGSSGSSGGSSASSNTSTTSTTDTENVPVVPNSKPIGLRGTHTQMEISISRPRRDLLPGTSANAMLKTSDLRDVMYLFGGSGLLRSEGDRMAVEMVEANGASPAQMSVTQMVAPEVAALRFRYFDGMTWNDTWDSDTVGRIPCAVEVMIGFPPPKHKPPLFNIAVSQSMDSFRTVIAIPVSDPFPKEFVQ